MNPGSVFRPSLRDPLDPLGVVAGRGQLFHDPPIVLLGDVGSAGHDPDIVALVAADDGLRVLLVQVNDQVFGLKRPNKLHFPLGI